MNLEQIYKTERTIAKERCTQLLRKDPSDKEWHQKFSSLSKDELQKRAKRINKRWINKCSKFYIPWVKVQSLIEEKNTIIQRLVEEADIESTKSKLSELSDIGEELYTANSRDDIKTIRAKIKQFVLDLDDAGLTLYMDVVELIETGFYFKMCHLVVNDHLLKLKQDK